MCLPIALPKIIEFIQNSMKILQSYFEFGFITEIDYQEYLIMPELLKLIEKILRIGYVFKQNRK